MKNMSLRNKINTFIMDTINCIQYPLFELFCKDTIPVYGYFQRFGFYTKRNNIGDDLNIDFFELVTKQRVIKAKSSFLVKKKGKVPFSLVGSILEYTLKQEIGSIVWGSGFKYYHETVDSDKLQKHRFLAVRGPKTRDIIVRNGGNCPEVYGDPIILLSKYYPLNCPIKYKYGIIPHKLDRHLDVVEAMSRIPGVVIIDVMNYSNWRDTVEMIVSCEMVISSSLHGIIISDSYGIPNIWARFSDYIDGKGFKFEDYFAGVDKNANCVDLSNGFDEKLIHTEKSKWIAPTIHPEFKNSCPLF